MTDVMTTYHVEYVIRGGRFKDENVFRARTDTQARFKAEQHVRAVLRDMEVQVYFTPVVKPKSKSRRRSACVGSVTNT